jgi:hypothetical protein
MSQKFSRPKILAILGTATLLAVWGMALGAADARAEDMDYSYSHMSPPGNYYVHPDGYQSVGAQLYLCPRPAPPLVGHTYITYPPLAPHEFLYHHHRVYWTNHADAPPTRTSVHWGGFCEFRVRPKCSLTPFRLIY